MEETQSRHRKELKTLEGEKRAALKKAKGTKGKKAKEVLKACVQDACDLRCCMTIRLFLTVLYSLFILQTRRRI
jgi:hypothetical protein